MSTTAHNAGALAAYEFVASSLRTILSAGVTEAAVRECLAHIDEAITQIGPYADTPASAAPSRPKGEREAAIAVIIATAISDTPVHVDSLSAARAYAAQIERMFAAASGEPSGAAPRVCPRFGCHARMETRTVCVRCGHYEAGSGAEAVVREAYAVIDELAPQWSGSSIATVLRAFIEAWQAVPDGPAQEELQAFRDALARKGQAVQAARLSLIQRVREFVARHARNGSKTGREDYNKIVPLSEFEALRVALDEFDRVAASKPLPTAPGAPEEGAGA